MAFLPFLTLKQAEFGGSDDAGSVMVEQIKGEYEPWFTPVLENWLGKEILGEIESLLFCLQTGIGVGIIAYYIGRFVERKNGKIINNIILKSVSNTDTLYYIFKLNHKCFKFFLYSFNSFHLHFL